MDIEKRINLLSRIVSGFGNTALSGDWPDTKCHFCFGRSTGYYDSGHSFTHDHNCIVLLIRQLNDDMRDEPIEDNEE